MTDWTDDTAAARAWLERGMAAAGMAHEVRAAADGAPAALVRLDHPVGAAFEATAVLRAAVLRLTIRDALGRPPTAEDLERMRRTWRDPVLARLYPSPFGPALGISFGIPVLSPADAIPLGRAFGMIGDAAAQARIGELPSHLMPVAVAEGVVAAAGAILRDPASGLGADAAGNVRTPAGAKAALSIGATTGALLFYAARERPDLDEGATLDRALERLNQMLPAGAVSRRDGAGVEAAVPLLAALTPLGPAQMIWAARTALAHLDVLRSLARPS